MKMVLLSDLHLTGQKFRVRIDDIEQIQWNKLSYVLDYAKKINAVLLQTGDWHDRPRSYEILLKEISLLKEKKVNVYAIFGQHDQYFRTRERTSMNILSATGLVNILGEKPTMFADSGLQDIKIYGCGYGEEVLEVKDRDKKGLNILVIHKMIVKEKLWPVQEDYIYAEDFLNKHKEFDLILCGDAHQKFFFEREDRVICNTGPMIRKSVDLYYHEPGFFLFNTENGEIEWIEIPHEPAEKVLSRKHIEDEKQVNEMLENFVQAVSSKEIEVGTSFEDNLESFIKENKIKKGVVDIISGVMEKGEK